MVLDRHSGERRPPSGDDWREATLLLDAFDDVGLYWSMCQHPSDAERRHGMVAYLADTFATFGKHVQDSFGDPESGAAGSWRSWTSSSAGATK